MKHFTIKLMQQENGLYKIQVFDNGFMAKEESNLAYDEAIKRIECIQVEERKNVSQT